MTVTDVSDDVILSKVQSAFTRCEQRILGHAVMHLFEALRYKLEGLGFVSDGVTGIFHLYNSSGRIMALGLTQFLTEMSTRTILQGVKAAGV
jgi:hypothetical protein